MADDIAERTKRRDGHSRLVYNKTTRTIDTVDPHPPSPTTSLVERLTGYYDASGDEIHEEARDAILALEAALKSAVKIADEAREEWDKAPSGMRAGKILIALAGGCPGYRADIDAIHAALVSPEQEKE